MSSDSNMGKLVGVCFITLWCIIAFGMGFSALQWGAPGIFALVPFGMGIFGIVLCISVAKGQPMSRRAPSIRSDQYTTYSGDSMGDTYTPVGRQERSLYQIPSRCPSCGASISTEEVDWVGPLQAKCPYCNATMDAEKRIL
ncbi:hypothetical protein EU546_01360 [Candidatus Thorarchaeota archaeon]|nr:MAG: hypothetical protein EU546_01360 [Candidatus Thorarchaeota archaeon]